LNDNESSDILKGNALEIYRFVLKTKKPLGIREIQRALKLSSPSVAQYHLNRLESAGFVKKEAGNYVIDRITLDSCVKISRFLIPKYLFYSVFAAVALIIDLTFLVPDVLAREYFFSIFVIGIFLVIFCYETIKVWTKGTL
jgi:DNA-binding transcriptional ArsR family regulator